MDLKKLKQIISFYKKHYKEIRLRENYKWEAAAEFRRADVMNAMDFPRALRDGLSAAGNLLDSGYYYPRTNLEQFLKKDASYVRHMFSNLYNEETNIYERIRHFSENAKTMQRKYFTAAEMSDHDQDEHAITVYLFFRYPEKYYIYKYTAFREFAKEIDYSYIPPKKSERNLPEFVAFCEALRSYLLKDEELMALEKERHELYRDVDPGFHLLTQDILISGATYFKRSGVFGDRGTAVRPEKFKLKAVKQEPRLQPIPFYDPVEITKYEEELKRIGENFVLEQERIKIASYHIAAKKQPVCLSGGRGRGEGYDILSYNRHGGEIYITVKTTAGSEDESFTISEAERIKSMECPESYYLYRVFRLRVSTGAGRYSVRQGSLSDLCVNPNQYRVVLETPIR